MKTNEVVVLQSGSFVYDFTIIGALFINIYYGGGGGIPKCDIIFQGVVLFIAQCDTGGVGGRVKMVIFG